MDKPLVWLKAEVKTPPFSAEARVEAGFLLRRLQKGESLGLPLDVFSKKTATTPNEVLVNCKRRLAAYISAATGGGRKRK